MLNLVRLHALNYVKDDGSPRKHKEATYQVCPVWYPPVTFYWLRVEYLVWSSMFGVWDARTRAWYNCVHKNQDMNNTIPGNATENGWKTFQRMMEHLHKNSRICGREKQHGGKMWNTWTSPWQLHQNVAQNWMLSLFLLFLKSDSQVLEAETIIRPCYHTVDGGNPAPVSRWFIPL